MSFWPSGAGCFGFEDVEVLKRAHQMPVASLIIDDEQRDGSIREVLTAIQNVEAKRDDLAYEIV